jgi:chloramphenicol-sensitive protein RarD
MTGGDGTSRITVAATIDETGGARTMTATATVTRLRANPLSPAVPPMTSEHRQGILYGLLSYGLWGLVPLYFHQVKSIAAIEVLMHRAIWCAGFLSIVVTIVGRWGDVLRVFRTPKTLCLLILSAALIACNWLQYIRSVEQNQIVQSSLGYFITPLLSVVIGLVVLGESMRFLQWLAVAVAAAGCALLIYARGEVPYIGLSLAVSFSLYSLVRKSTPVDGLLGLTIETLVLCPIAIVFLAVRHRSGDLLFGTQGVGMDILLAASGVVTALPLLAFGQAARRLPLSSLGFLQFLSPSIQFLIAVFVYGEEFDMTRGISFAIIWTGVALFLVDLWLAHWPAYEVPMEPE